MAVRQLLGDLSHPSRVRGLKLIGKEEHLAQNEVAPFAGAWIEIQIRTYKWTNKNRRTLRGCVDWNNCLFSWYCCISCRTLRGCVDWNDYLWALFKSLDVAPFAGAWIEIKKFWTPHPREKKSHPSRVRGLKYYVKLASCLNEKSHPSRVRGLKLTGINTGLRISESHPSRVRGLKLFTQYLFIIWRQVAPFAGAWIEILMVLLIIWLRKCRTLRGCVDWNIHANPSDGESGVAPFAGAWIEIYPKAKGG